MASEKFQLEQEQSYHNAWTNNQVNVESIALVDASAGLEDSFKFWFDADNHDSLGSDVTGLMIDLSRVPFDDDDLPAAIPPPTGLAALAAPPSPIVARSWRERLTILFAGRSDQK